MKYTSLSLLGFKSIKPGAYPVETLKKFIVSNLYQSNLKQIHTSNLISIDSKGMSIVDLNGIRRLKLESRETFRVNIPDKGYLTPPVHTTTGMCIRLKDGGYVRCGINRSNGGRVEADVSIPADIDTYIEAHYFGPRTNPRTLDVYVNGVKVKSVSLSGTESDGFYLGLWSSSGNPPNDAYVSDIYIAANVNQGSSEIPLLGPIVVEEGMVNVVDGKGWMTGVNQKPTLEELNEVINGELGGSGDFELTSITSGGYNQPLSCTFIPPDGDNFIGVAVNINLTHDEALANATVVFKNGASGGSLTTPVTDKKSVNTNISAAFLHNGDGVTNESIKEATLTITPAEIPKG
ncbi:hypothetical protein [Proteus columbae]|uniref:hypothetical protein n=1 Tax=Proteus columbae TaxID=1987580 RepID=UPI00288992FA|nr:hypothetical protein [Proteus columbae]